MKNLLFTLLAGMLIISACSQTGSGDYSNAKSNLTTETDSISFMLGYQIGNGFDRDSIDMTFDAFIMGYNLGHKKDTSVVNPRLADEFFRALQMKMQMKQEMEFKAKGEKNLVEGPKYLEENKKKDGVIELPSGLQYRVLKQGNGARTDSASHVKAHYIGRFIDGKEFDNSYKVGNPIHVPVHKGVIPGMEEALLMMREGDKWELTIPSDLAYGPNGQPPAIPPHAVLIFELELLEITTKGRPQEPGM